MSRKFNISVILIAGAIGAHAIAQHVQPASQLRRPVNESCPISKEPVDGRTFITVGENIVGFCCPGCDEQFLAWDDARKNTFIERAASGDAEPEPARPAQPAAVVEPPTLSTIYPLSTCPVSDRPLGAMGAPVVRTYSGREIRFCCDACLPRFEEDQEKYLRKIDEQIVATQLAYYPLDKCIVAGGALGSMGEPDNFVHQNRLVRFCCAGCRNGFISDAPAKFRVLDQAAAEEQRASYPLDTCVVTGKKLGSMGEPAERIIAGRLVRLCCPPCEKQLRAEPARFIAKIDDAWRAAGRKGLPPLQKGD